MTRLVSARCCRHAVGAVRCAVHRHTHACRLVSTKLLTVLWLFVAQVPLVLTCPPKKSKGSKAASGCGCMIPAASAAASKVLSKVSPNSRLGSGGSSGGKDAKAAAVQGANPGLEKPSPDRQRLIGQGLSSSDEQGLVSDSLSQGTAEGSSSIVGPMPGMDALHYFGVFDGHGGADAARHCAQRMHQVGL